MAIYMMREKRVPWANTILYLPLENDLLDHSSNQYTISNWWTAPTQATIGYQFGTNSNQYLKTDSLSTPTYATWSVWANRTGYYTQPAPILLKTYTSSPRWYFNLIAKEWNYWNENKVNIEAWTTWWSAVVEWPSISTSWWHHYWFTYDWTNLKLYFDGTLYWTTSMSWTLKQGNSAYVIWRHPNFSTQYYQGYISEVIIESGTWTAQGFTDYYEDTKSKYGY